MARRQKGPRLYLRGARGNRRAYWEIRDGQKEISTGCSSDDLEGAKHALARYLAATHMPPVGARHPSQILITEVIAIYRREREASLSRADMVQYSVPHLVDFWGDAYLSAINGANCRAYVKWRCKKRRVSLRSDGSSRSGDIRAAIKYFHEEYGPLEAVPVVKLPPKAEPRQRALTRQEAAQLLRAAKSPHLRRFILIGLYTGMRSQAILSSPGSRRRRRDGSISTVAFLSSPRGGPQDEEDAKPEAFHNPKTAARDTSAGGAR